jgi:hypothetical protein
MHSPRQGMQRRGRIVIPAITAISAALFWLIVGLGGTAVSADISHVVTIHHTQMGEPTTTTSGPQRAAVHGHKEGPLAVAFSIIGVIVVAVFIVGLSSLSVRRRTRDRPATGRGSTPDDRRRPLR